MITLHENFGQSADSVSILALCVQRCHCRFAFSREAILQPAFIIATVTHERDTPIQRLAFEMPRRAYRART